MGNKDSGLSADGLGLLVHAYNNYLAGVVGFTELALMDCSQESVKQTLESSLLSGQEAVEFGKQLLSAVSRLQLEMQAFNISRLKADLAHTSAFKIITNFTDDCYIKTNPDWFTGCIRATAQFCLDYSQHSSVNITMNETSQDLALSFNNPLLVFKQQQLERLFELFYTSRFLLGSKGAGLAYVKGFIEQLNGRMYWAKGEGIVMRIPKYFAE